jgi:hypothetical protein
MEGVDDWEFEQGFGPTPGSLPLSLTLGCLNSSYEVALKGREWRCAVDGRVRLSEAGQNKETMWLRSCRFGLPEQSRGCRTSLA